MSRFEETNSITTHKMAINRLGNHKGKRKDNDFYLIAFTFSLRIERFRLVSEQRKTEEEDSRF